MSTPDNLSEQILALPAGAGSVRSAGQTFEADPYTGTGRYAVPIKLPPGPNGIVPSLSLSYSTHGGNGICGVGWSLGLARVERRTDHGIPSYDDSADRFAIQGDELLPVGNDRYRYKDEDRFARVAHVTSNGNDCWVVTQKDGTRTFYGLVPEHRIHDGSARVSAWLPTRKIDTLGNAVEYTWVRDPQTRDSRLTEVTWAGCYRARLVYEARPDPVISARAGFAVTCDQRIQEIQLDVKRNSNGAYTTYRKHTLAYSISALTGRSLLQSVTVTGIDGSGNSRSLPPVNFGYVDPDLRDQKWHSVAGAPTRALSDRNVTLLPGKSGLPDALEVRDLGYFLRENLGSGKFGLSRQIAGPPGVKLSDPGVFLSDMDGDGFADLVVQGGHRVYQAAAGGEGFVRTLAYAQRPSVDLDGPDVRMGDFSGSGMPEALHHGLGGYTLFKSVGSGRWSPPVRIGPGPAVRFDDPHTHVADLSGDGLTDLVYVERSRILVYRGLGNGRFDAPIVMEAAPDFGEAFNVKAVRFADLTGSGQADLVYTRAGLVQVALNQGGTGFGPLTTLGAVRQSSKGHVEVTDLLGTGAKGILFTDNYGSGEWRFLELFPAGNPDLLETIDNGLGGTTTRPMVRPPRTGREIEPVGGRGRLHSPCRSVWWTRSPRRTR